jgi:hypothetical protein
LRPLATEDIYRFSGFLDVMPSRRTFVATLAAASATLAGCAGLGDGSMDSPQTDETAADGPGTTGTDSKTTDGTPAVGFDGVSPQDVDGRIRVLPDGLRDLLVDAARADGVVRGHYEMLMNRPPSPDLAALEAVELRGTDGVDGTYTADVQAGGRYRMQFVTERVASVPADATVVDGGELTGPQREFVLNASGSSAAEVYPGTELGTWARTVLDEGYVRIDGEVYRGRERQQTDAEFFANRVWYVLSLAAGAGATEPAVLDCTSVEQGVVDEVAALVAADTPGGDAEATPPSEALVRLARETDAVMLHNLTLRLSIE